LNIESIIDRQRFQYLSDNLIPGGGSALFGVAAIIFVFKDKVDDIVLFTWAGAAILVSMLRILLRPWVRRNLDNPHRYPMIERRLIIVSAAAGVLWGISFILLALPEDMFYWLFLVFLIGGYAAGSVFTTSASLPASAGYLFSALLPIVAWLFFQDVPHGMVMGALMLFYIATLWSVARNSNRMLLKNYHLFDEKLRLTDSLKQSYQQLLTETNEHKKASEALAASNKRYQQLVEIAPIGMAVIQEQGQLTFANPYWHELISTPSDQPVTLEQLIEEGEEEHLAAILEHPGKQKLRTTMCWKKDQQHSIQTEVISYPIQYENRLSILLLVISIEDRIKAEQIEKIKLANKESDYRLSSLQMMAGGVAHDFNNLLAVIIGNAELALIRFDDNNKQRQLESLNQIKQAGERAAGLGKKMLAYSGHGGFVSKSINLSSYLNNAQPKLQKIIAAEQTLTLNHHQTNTTILADSLQLEQLLEGLVTNASEAYEGEQGLIIITSGIANAIQLERSALDVHICNPADFLYLQVSDYGCGMSSETVKRVFDPFFSTKFTGRGLEMSAIFGIIQGMNGHIHIISAAGEGTTIEILLPRHESAVIQPQPSISEVTTPIQVSRRILIIDDEEIVRDTCSAILKQYGHSVLTASDGPSGIECYRRQMQEIHCIILDMTMPVMDGSQCFLALREINPDVPIIISSGYSREDILNHFGTRKPAHFLQKPYSHGALIEMIELLSSIDS